METRLFSLYPVQYSWIDKSDEHINGSYICIALDVGDVKDFENILEKTPWDEEILYYFEDLNEVWDHAGGFKVEVIFPPTIIEVEVN